MTDPASAWPRSATASRRPASRASRGGRRHSIAVTKTRSAAEIEALIAAGQRDFGENRVQEALAKWPAIRAASSRRPPALRRPAAIQQGRRGRRACSTSIHSLDRRSLLEALAKEADKPGAAPASMSRSTSATRSRKAAARSTSWRRLLDRGPRLAAAARRADGASRRRASSRRPISRCLPSWRGVMTSPA